MINRTIIKNLREWAKEKDRKPLILRGARQVGKTTVVREFAKDFDQYIELDFVIPFGDMLIPVEVKSGASGSLRSLHQFMDRAPHDIAVRIYSGKFSIETARTVKGKKFQLINLPFYYIGQMDKILLNILG